MEFAPYDQRRYPVLAVREGYAAWAPTYEEVVQDAMDLRLLRRVRGVNWSGIAAAADLACGTGRIGAWLRGQGVGRVDGVDLTPEMLAKAAARGVYDRLVQGDIRATGLADGSYRLVTEVLACEHLPDLGPLYAEAARLAMPDGLFVAAGYHSHFLLSGIPTHFDRGEGGPATIECYVHLFSDHVRAAHAAGWQLDQMEEGLVDAEMLAAKPKWARYRGLPISFCLLWRKGASIPISPT